MTECDIESLLVSNLKGWGVVKLTKLNDGKLCTLAKEMGVDEHLLNTPLNHSNVIDAILERKRERANKRIPSPLVPASKYDSMTEEGAARLLQSTVRYKYRDVFVSRHQLKIMSFNSLKLRTGKAGLHEQWIAFAAMMGEFDIVMMSEVPAKQAVERAQSLLQLIGSCCSPQDEQHDLSWSLHVSDPSGPGNPEVHVVFVRSPLTVMHVRTLSSIEGVKMDHSPFQIAIEDPRFTLNKQFVLTHVHMPPSSRANDRDTQLRMLLRCYPLQSDLRFDLPFDAKAAKERGMKEVTHIVCGDFNVYPDPEVYLLKSNGWAEPLLPEKVSTSSGGRAYDNFIIDHHAAKRCSTFSDVMELALAQNSSLGELGLSDHDPIVLTVKELPLRGPRHARKVCMPPPLPPPPPTPLCTSNGFPLDEVSDPITVDKETTQPIRPVGATPRCIADTPEDEPTTTECELTRIAQTPRRTFKKQVVQRPEIDMDMFNTNKPVLCWDTDTSSLGKPAICQLAYVLISADGSHHVYNKVWNLPKAVDMSPEAVKLHGITHDRSTQGVHPFKELLSFYNLVHEVMADGGVVVGHNVQFDCEAFNFTSNEWDVVDESGHALKPLEHRDMLCTMQHSKRYSTLTNIDGHQQALKNAQLCKRFTQTRY
jgi:endonuclease/exonuclease/phosphatase family metal-dependent hydrolase